MYGGAPLVTIDKWFPPLTLSQCCILILHMKSTCIPILAPTDHLVERKTTLSSLDPQFLRVRNDIGGCCLSYNKYRWVGNKDVENFRALWVGGGKRPSISSFMSCRFARLLALFVFFCFKIRMFYGVTLLVSVCFLLIAFVEYVTSNISRFTISIDS